MNSSFDKFKRYHEKNPDVYKLFKSMAQRARESGHTRYSSWVILNVIRWKHDVNPERIGAFKVSNGLMAFYSRKLVADDSSFQGFFELRELRGPEPSTEELRSL
jgi:hypothetical protein